jgi:Tfp pilus assembly protein PilF
MRAQTAISLIVTLLLLAGCSAVGPARPVVQDSQGAASAGASGDVQLDLEGPARTAPDASAEALRRFAKANQAIDEQDWQTALAELQFLLEAHPGLSGPSLNLALVYQSLGEAELAGQYYQRTLEINPNNLAAYNQYAIFLREQGEFHDSERIYKNALRVWEAHPQTHLNIGILYDLYLGDQVRALQHFQRYQQLTGSDNRLVSAWIADLERQSMMLVGGN